MTEKNSGSRAAAGGESAQERLWRQEVASRVRQHRTRRGKNSGSEAGPELGFPMESSSFAPPETPSFPLPPISRPEPPKIVQSKIVHLKIIQFPRLAAVEPSEESSAEELAEPVLEAPRILEAPASPPEQMDFFSSFADIRLDEEQSRPREQLELPPRPAPLQQRLIAGLADLLVVFAAGAAFSVLFMAMAGSLPESRVVLSSTAAFCAVLWVVYQYLFMVYAARTPGMKMAQIELRTFQGRPAPVFLRRRRVLASALSAISMGLGFAWAWVDEDTLGWHDRITQTYVRPIE